MNSVQQIRLGCGLTGLCVKPQEPVARCLFIHGLGGQADQFVAWLQKCYQAKIEAWALNLRGHADSLLVGNLGGVSLMNYADDVINFLSEIKKVANFPFLPSWLVGHSMGGLIAQLVAQKSQLFDGLVLLASAPPSGIPLDFGVTWRLRRWSYLRAVFGNKPVIMDEADIKHFGLSDAKNPESGRAIRESAVPGCRFKVDPQKVLHGRRVSVLGARYDKMFSPRIQEALAHYYYVEPKMFPFGHMVPLEDNGITIRYIITDILS